MRYRKHFLNIRCRERGERSHDGIVDTLRVVVKRHGDKRRVITLFYQSIQESHFPHFTHGAACSAVNIKPRNGHECAVGLINGGFCRANGFRVVYNDIKVALRAA